MTRNIISNLLHDVRLPDLEADAYILIYSTQYQTVEIVPMYEYRGTEEQLLTEAITFAAGCADELGEVIVHARFAPKKI